MALVSVKGPGRLPSTPTGLTDDFLAHPLLDLTHPLNPGLTQGEFVVLSCDKHCTVCRPTGAVLRIPAVAIQTDEARLLTTLGLH